MGQLIRPLVWRHGKFWPGLVCRIRGHRPDGKGHPTGFVDVCLRCNAIRTNGSMRDYQVMTAREHRDLWATWKFTEDSAA